MLNISAMTKEQREKEAKRKEGSFIGLVGCRNNDANLRYARGTIVTIINLGAFSFLGTHLANPIPILYLILGIFGVASCFFWWLINKKAQDRINYWNACLAKLEPSETEPSDFRIFTGEEWRRLNKWPNFQALFNLLPVTFCILWVGIGIMYLVIEKKQPEEKAPIIFFQLHFKTFNQHNILKGEAQ